MFLNFGVVVVIQCLVGVLVVVIVGVLPLVVDFGEVMMTAPLDLAYSALKIPAHPLQKKYNRPKPSIIPFSYDENHKNTKF